MLVFDHDAAVNHRRQTAENIVASDGLSARLDSMPHTLCVGDAVARQVDRSIEAHEHRQRCARSRPRVDQRQHAALVDSE